MEMLLFILLDDRIKSDYVLSLLLALTCLSFLYGMNNRQWFEKIHRLVNLKLCDQSYCCSTEILRDQRRVFRGFLMPRVPGAALSLKDGVLRPSELVRVH